MIYVVSGFFFFFAFCCCLLCRVVSEPPYFMINSSHVPRPTPHTPPTLRSNSSQNFFGIKGEGLISLPPYTQNLYSAINFQTIDFLPHYKHLQPTTLLFSTRTLVYSPSSIAVSHAQPSISFSNPLITLWCKLCTSFAASGAMIM